MQRTSSTEPPQRTILGQRLFTLDGQNLGTVIETYEGYLRLRRRFRRDRWLSEEEILHHSWNGRTVTRFGADVAYRYYVPAPPEWSAPASLVA